MKFKPKGAEWAGISYAGEIEFKHGSSAYIFLSNLLS